MTFIYLKTIDETHCLKIIKSSQLITFSIIDIERAFLAFFLISGFSILESH